MDIKHDYFSNEAEVLAEIDAAGQHPVTLDFGAETIAEHWHDFDAVVYIMDGELTVTDIETGERCVCTKGSKICAPRGVLHSEETPGYRATVGLPEEFQNLAQPIHRPPPVVLTNQ